MHAAAYAPAAPAEFPTRRTPLQLSSRFFEDASARPPHTGGGHTFEVDQHLRAIRHNGRVIPLTPRSFALIAYLSRYSDRIVDKDELLANIWPAGATEHSLRQEIYSLRRQLAKHNASSCIVTVSQRGYRFEPNPAANGAAQSGEHYRIGLTKYEHRALAATSFFEMKSDSAGWKRALFWYERLSKASPELLEAHLGAARSALRLASRAALSPKDALAIASRHIAAAARLSPKNVQVETLAAAVDGLLNGNVGRALGVASSLCDRAPGDAEAHSLMATLYLAQGNVRKALEAQHAAMLSAPRSLEAHVQYGQILVYARDYEAALNEFSFIVKLQHDNVDAVEGSATALTLLGRYDEALSLLDAGPCSIATSAVSCIALARQGKTEAARKVLEKIEGMQATTYVSRLYLARCYAVLGDRARAGASLRAAQGEPPALYAHLDPLLQALNEEHK